MCQLEGMLNVSWISSEPIRALECAGGITLIVQSFAPALISYDLIVGSILES